MAFAVMMQHEVRLPLGRGARLCFGILFDFECTWEKFTKASKVPFAIIIKSGGLMTGKPSMESTTVCITTHLEYYLI